MKNKHLKYLYIAIGGELFINIFYYFSLQTSSSTESYFFLLQFGLATITAFALTTLLLIERKKFNHIPKIVYFLIITSLLLEPFWGIVGFILLSLFYDNNYKQNQLHEDFSEHLIEK